VVGVKIGDGGVVRSFKDYVDTNKRAREINRFFCNKGKKTSFQTQEKIARYNPKP
jgi:hypothetical protein